MTTAEQSKKLENLVEQKILEFLGDPDAGLELRKDFVAKLRGRLKKRQKTVPLSVVIKKYGLR